MKKRRPLNLPKRAKRSSTRSRLSPLNLSPFHRSKNYFGKANWRPMFVIVLFLLPAFAYYLLPRERKAQSKRAFEYVNQLRFQRSRPALVWDERAYILAVERAKDIDRRNYYDHVTPDGDCAETIKSDFGFSDEESLAENLGGMTYNDDALKLPVMGTNVNEAIEGWMGSRGHRYNLLYPSHTSGAVGCYKAVCLFFGVNKEGFGGGKCTTAAEGLAYWQSAPLQPNETE